MAVDIYEHEVNDGGRWYMYDAVQQPQDGWGPGTPRFLAVPAGSLAQQLNDAARVRVDRRL